MLSNTEMGVRLKLANSCAQFDSNCRTSLKSSKSERLTDELVGESMNEDLTAADAPELDGRDVRAVPTILVWLEDSLCVWPKGAIVVLLGKGLVVGVIGVKTPVVSSVINSSESGLDLSKQMSS